MASLSITILLCEREEALARPPSGLLLNGTSLQRRRFICEVGNPSGAPVHAADPKLSSPG